ncbi:MAG TPA: hypothetical protein VGL83_19865 [Stellaceae bacterium]|jgi:hypothetical protein
MLTFHEKQICEAIVRYLEAREGERRADVASPEDDHHPNAVELVWRLGQKLFALEHTGIEPFEGHMQLEAEAERHFGPISARLANALPPDVFELQVPAKAMAGCNRVEIARIQEAIVAWVKQVGPTLKVHRYADYRGGHFKRVSPAGVPFELSLYRFETLPSIGGRFRIKHVFTGDPEHARAERLRRACDKKFPKLAAWKRDSGARTILVLEDNDIQLTNHAAVADAYVPLARGRSDRPDETYIVSTCVNPWDAWPLLVDGVSLHDLSARETDCRWEIDPATLGLMTTC